MCIRDRDLATASSGKPQHLPVLVAMGRMYRDLGIREQVVEIYAAIAGFTTEPALLAQAAVALVDAGATHEGLAVAKRIQTALLDDAAAYELLMAHGRALLDVDPRQAVDRMEEAHEAYPAQRTADGDQRLLEAYLAVGNTARARALVMDIETLVRRSPVDAPRLAKAANVWADYLYARGDFRGAADAYAQAIKADLSGSPDLPWVQYQRGNALFELADFEESARLFDTVAASKVKPWAEQASLMAEHVRLEQRLRGLPVTPRDGVQKG